MNLNSHVVHADADIGRMGWGVKTDVVVHVDWSLTESSCDRSEVVVGRGDGRDVLVGGDGSDVLVGRGERGDTAVVGIGDRTDVVVGVDDRSDGSNLFVGDEGDLGIGLGLSLGLPLHKMLHRSVLSKVLGPEHAIGIDGELLGVVVILDRLDRRSADGPDSRHEGGVGVGRLAVSVGPNRLGVGGVGLGVRSVGLSVRGDQLLGLRLTLGQVAGEAVGVGGVGLAVGRVAVRCEGAGVVIDVGVGGEAVYALGGGVQALRDRVQSGA